MSIKTVEGTGCVWHHVPEVANDDIQVLQEKFKFHPLDYEDLKTETPLSKMDTYKHYVFCLFHLPFRDAKTGRIRAQEVAVFLSEKQIVTITHEPIKAVDQLFQKMEKQIRARSSTMGKGTSLLLYHILYQGFRGSQSIVSNLTAEVSRLEDELREGSRRHTTIELGNVRRDVLYLRHIIDPQRQILTSLGSLKRYFLPEELQVYFDDVDDILDIMWTTSNNLKLLIEGLFDMNEALLSHRTNDVILLLTVLSASLMAPTLVAGFYGMNVDWLPFAGDSSMVLLVFIVSFIAVLVAIGFVIWNNRRKIPAALQSKR